MDEIEWWEFDSAAEMAEQAAGDIAFVIQSAVEAHGGARIAVPGAEASEALLSALARRADIDWARVTVIPTDDRLVALDDEASSHRRLHGWFGAKGAEIVSLVDEAALGDVREAGRLADARLSLLHWPLDLAWLGVGAEGEVAGMRPGPDLEAALSGPRARRAVGIGSEAGSGVTLTAAALSSARTVMIVLSGAEKRRRLEQAIREGPLSSDPIGRVLAELDTPVDIFWSAGE